jgi:hypothetical protein
VSFLPPKDNTVNIQGAENAEPTQRNCRGHSSSGFFLFSTLSSPLR